MLASSVSQKDPQRLMSPPSADGWGKHGMTSLDFTDTLNMISPTVGKQFESLTYFHTGACTLSRLSSKAQQRLFMQLPCKIFFFLSNSNPKIHLTTAAISANMMKHTL